MSRFTIPILLTLLTLFLFDTLHSLPRFAVRSGAKCQSCHVNPTGGGMRNFYGATFYGREALPIKSWEEQYGLEDFTTQLNDFISLGADFRTLFYSQEQSADNTTNQSFFQMQGDIYLRANVAKKVNLYLDKGLYDGFEIFGIANILPADGYVKVGRFVPAFGLRMDDHTAFVRTETGFSQRAEDTGVELGFLPGPVSAIVALSNGGKRGIPSDKLRAVLGRVEAKFSADEFNFLLGGSAYRLSSGRAGKLVAGGFLGVAFQGNASILAEVDFIDDRIGNADTKSMVNYVELNYAPIQGFDLKAAYDFFDPDTKNKTGSVSRYSFGFEFFPIAGIEVRPMYRIIKEEPVDQKNNEYHLLFHFYL